MKVLFLYTTLGCHLCEQAKDLIEPHLDLHGLQLKAIEISDSDELMIRYGIRIPVIQREDNGEELGWPFDVEQLHGFLSS
jgi:glutaredoxin